MSETSTSFFIPPCFAFPTSNNILSKLFFWAILPKRTLFLALKVSFFWWKTEGLFFSENSKKIGKNWPFGPKVRLEGQFVLAYISVQKSLWRENLIWLHYHSNNFFNTLKIPLALWSTFCTTRHRLKLKATQTRKKRKKTMTQKSAK